MYNFIAKIWKILDGNKTIICLAIADILGKLVEFNVVASQYVPIINFMSWLFYALGAGAFTHHVKKGYFSAEKG